MLQFKKIIIIKSPFFLIKDDEQDIRVSEWCTNGWLFPTKGKRQISVDRFLETFICLYQKNQSSFECVHFLLKKNKKFKNLTASAQALLLRQKKTFMIHFQVQTQHLPKNTKLVNVKMSITVDIKTCLYYKFSVEGFIFVLFFSNQVQHCFVT